MKIPHWLPQSESDEFHTSLQDQRLTGPNSNSAGAVTLLCSRYWPDYHGGVEQRMGYVSRTMARRGICVDVLTENRTQSSSYEAMEPNLFVRRLDPPQSGRLWRWDHLLRLRWWQNAVQSWAGPGLIWATDPVMAVATILAGRATDLVYNPAGCVAGMRHAAKAHPQVITMNRPRSLTWLDRYAYQQAPHVIVSSHNLARQYHRFYGQRKGSLAVVHPGTQTPLVTTSRDRARQQWGISRDAFVIGFVGRLDPCKAVDSLLHAVKHIALKNTDRVLLVGDGPDRMRLESLAVEIGLTVENATDYVRWAGSLPNVSIAYPVMDVLVLPSVYEAFGLVMLEAMAHSVPVIARQGDSQTVLTAADEVVLDGQTGLLFDPHDDRDLAAKLKMIRANAPWREALGRRARQLATTRPWSRVVDDYCQILDISGDIPIVTSRPTAVAA